VSIALGAHRRSDFGDASVIPSRSSPFSRAIAQSAFHERVLLAYLVGFLIVVLNGEGPRRVEAAALLAGDVGLFVLGLIYARGRAHPHPLARAVVSRLLVLGTILGTFFQLHVLLPAARGATWDARLRAFDVYVFGVEPATSWDRWVSPATTEWFSFFYFSYFVLLAVHVIPMILFERRVRLLGEFALGMVAVYCIGQFVYLLVPGFGPYKVLAFSHELSGPVWWKLVQAGAATIEETRRTDIFPSLHTAGPAFLTLFSIRHRALAPFRLTWPILAFFTTQIMIATMFLRWHYLIDVIAGVALAFLAVKVASRFTTEQRARELRGDPPVWTTLELRDLGHRRR
jgi:hypothetical protein